MKPKAKAFLDKRRQAMQLGKGALDKSLLHQKRLNHILNGIRLL